MPIQIQIELPDEVNKKVEFYKTEHSLKTKEEAILQMLELLPFRMDIPGLPRISKNGKVKK